MTDRSMAIVIPTRDRVESLRECLAALGAARRIDECNILVADDCSADRSLKQLVTAAGATYLRLDRPGGSSAARNLALASSSEPLVLFIDDDIVASVDLVERHLRHHEQDPRPEVARQGLVTWDPRRPITAHMRWLEDGGPLFAFNLIGDPERVNPEHFCTANASVKRQLLDRVEGPFDEGLRRFTDVDLALRLDAAGMALSFDADAIGWHLRSDTPRTTDMRMFDVGRAADRLVRKHPDNGVVPEPPSNDLLGAMKAASARFLSPLAPILGPEVSDRIWSCRAAWAYGRGRRAS